MQIRLVSTSKKRFLPLLLLADEQESMIDRYLERGDLYVMYDKLFTEPVAVAVVTDEGKGIRELKKPGCSSTLATERIRTADGGIPLPALPECVSHADGRHRRQSYDHFILSELRVCLLAHGARLFYPPL